MRSIFVGWIRRPRLQSSAAAYLLKRALLAFDTGRVESYPPAFMASGFCQQPPHAKKGGAKGRKKGASGIKSH
jgi:hypothetical protein